MKLDHVILLLLLLLLLLLISIPNLATSQSIIKNLPGFDGDLPFNLETGYVGVGYKDEVQLFYYFLESERNPKEDPLILWFTGGPGCSVLSAILYQHGPLHFNYADTTANKPTLLLNPYSWTKVANIVYLDTPVGAGFSYATNAQGYKTGDLLAAAQTYDFLRKWLLAHPKFLSNPLYVGSDSYGGLVLPIVLQEITSGNGKGNEPTLNLKGYILGNPLTDYKNDASSRIPYAYEKSLIPNQLYESTRENCKGEYLNPDRKNEKCISNLKAINKSFGELYPYNILEPRCSSWDLSPLLGGADMLTIMRKIDMFSASQLSREWCRDFMLVYSQIWANDKDVQRALHVREGTIKEWPRCNLSLKYDKDVRTTIQYHRSFSKTNAYRALIFSGDHDLAIPYVGTHSWIQTLNLTVTKDWQPWFLDNQVAGHVIVYSKRKYNVTFAIIKGGGHSASEIRPKESFAMIDRDKQLCSCIYKVPTTLLSGNDHLFHPKLYSIGPYHQDAVKSQFAERIKLWYLNCVISRAQNDPSGIARLKSFVEAIRPDVKKCRECYSEKALIQADIDEFIEMMIVDGCFLIELFRRFSKVVSPSDDDPMFNMPLLNKVLVTELLLLENQLPWIVLIKLFDLTKEDHTIFWSALRSDPEGIPVDPSAHYNHLLDVQRSFLLAGREDVDGGFKPIPCVTDLLRAGIDFVGGDKKALPLVNIAFDSKTGVITIPPIIILDNAESLLRNLIAYEQCDKTLKDRFKGYAAFLDNLINSGEDLEYLRKKGIVRFFLSAEEVSSFTIKDML